MSRLKFPSGYKRGCLPRQRQPGDVCGFVRARVKAQPIDDLIDLIRQQDGMRHFEHVIYDQDGRGSCANEAGCGALSSLRLSEGQPFVEYNPWGTYHDTSGGRDRGSSLYDVVRSLQTRGAYPVSVWPRYDDRGRIVHDFDEEPSKEAQEEALNYRLGPAHEVETLRELCDAYVNSFAVVYGADGHSTWITRIEPPTTTDIRRWIAEYRNSWKPSWGDQGHGRIYLRDIDFRYQCFAYEGSAVRCGEQEAPAP